MLLSTSMVSGSGLVDPPAGGMMPAAMLSIANTAKAALAGGVSAEIALRDIHDLAVVELQVEEQLEAKAAA